MGKLTLLSGNKAVAYGVKLSRVQVVSAYPITPQTPIVEYIAEFVAKGELKAEYVHPEGEHSAIGAALAAALGGARSFTATCSQGFGYGFEVIAQAPAYRAPFVMAVANRTLGWYWALASDYSDTMTARDLGWIQYYVEGCQECLDAVIQLYRIAEDERVLLPAMMCLDGFHISHSSEPVNIPDQAEVDEFLPPRKVYDHTTDPDSKGYVFPVLPAPLHTPYRRMFEEILHRAKDVIREVTKEFEERFGRKYGLIEEYRVEGADHLLITMGSMSTAAKRAVDKARSEGVKVGLIRVAFYRPFPAEEIRKVIEREGVASVGVVDRAVAHGTRMGPLGLDVLSVLYNLNGKVPVTNFIAGMGGDDVSVNDFMRMIDRLTKSSCPSGGCVRTVYIEHKPPKKAGLVEFKNTVYAPGCQLCAGCGATLVTRHVLRVIGKRSVLVFPPNCVSASIAMHFPNNWVGVPCVLANYAATGAYARGLVRAYRVRGKKDVKVVAFAGDGCTADIGLQSLSSAAECGEPVLWITYDNEAYMNTGIQRSGTTPAKAWTTTTPVGTVWRGKREFPKDLISIMIAHRVPYIATASPAFLKDMEVKLRKAMEVVERGEGLAYVHIHSPCPTGWRFPESKTVEVARKAVLTGAWPLLEVDHGVFRLTVKPSKLLPLKEYVRLQGRFAHLSDGDVGEIQQVIEANWRRLLELHGKKLF